MPIPQQPPSPPPVLVPQCSCPAHACPHDHIIETVLPQDDDVVDRGERQCGRKEIGFTQRTEVPAGMEEGVEQRHAVRSGGKELTALGA